LYDSLSTIMMDKWREIHLTHNYTLLIKKGKASEPTLLKIWNKLENEFLSKYGLTEMYLEYLHLQKNYVLLGSQFIQKDPDRRVQQQLMLMERRIEEIEMKFKEGISFEEMYAWVCIENKLHLPLSKTSVDEYQSILKQTIKITEIKNHRALEQKRKRTGTHG